MLPFTTLISVAELAALPPALVLPVDCRHSLSEPGWGAKVYRAGHLPGAVHADLERDLSAPPPRAAMQGRHPLPMPAAFADTLACWGWQAGRLLVAYDAAGGAMAAARLWWLARLAGIHAVAVLDGGLPAWRLAGQRLTQGPEQVRQTVAEPLRFEPLAQATTAELTGWSQARCRLLLDARSRSRFLGENEPVDPVAGHVPGAQNRPFSMNLDAQAQFRPRQELRTEFEAILAGRPPSALVHMCGSGVSACHNLLAMEYAGLTGSRLYPPSWSGWIAAAGVVAGSGK